MKTLVLAGLAVFIAACGSPEEAESEKLNFVLIFTDEMEPDYLECYNDGSIYPTPRITELAASGTRFTSAYVASSMCTPSRFAVLTGTYAGRCKSPGFLEENPNGEPCSIAWNTGIDKPTPTIADFVSAGGYVTGMAGKWHVGGREMGRRDVPVFDGGEEVIGPDLEEKLQAHQRVVRDMVRETGGFDEAHSVLWGNFDGFPVRSLRVHNIPWIIRGAVRFLDNRATDGKPFFLYVAPTAVHGPAHQESLQMDPVYTPEGRVEDVAEFDLDREALREEIADIPAHERHKYVGLAYTDHLVGRIMERLGENGQLENTVVVFMADHNVEPGKATCYEKGNRVPFIVKWPGKPQGQVCDRFVQSVDLARTISVASGDTAAGSRSLDGVNMEPLLMEDPGSVRETVYTESGYTRAVRAGKYKYIAFRPPDASAGAMKTGETRYAPNHLATHKQAHSQIAMQYFPHYFDQDQLYDLERDPYEMNNLAYEPEYREVLNEMRAVLKTYLETFDHPFSLERIPFMETAGYREFAENTKAIGTDFIEWFSRDHGVLVYPPE